MSSITKVRKQLDSMKAARRRDREDQAAMSKRAGRIGVGFGTSVVNGFAMTKFPRLASFDAAGRVPTAPVLAGIAGIISLFADDDGTANAAEGVANGLGLPYGSQVGERLAGKVG